VEIVGLRVVWPDGVAEWFPPPDSFATFVRGRGRAVGAPDWWRPAAGRLLGRSVVV